MFRAARGIEFSAHHVADRSGEVVQGRGEAFGFGKNRQHRLPVPWVLVTSKKATVIQTAY